MQLDHFLAQHVRDAICGSSLPYIVSICGWADTGKSTLAKSLTCALHEHGIKAEWISTDAFMKNRAERHALGITGYDLLAIDAALLADSIARFTSGTAFEYHPYDNKSGTKQLLPTTISPCQVLVVEGIHAFHPLVEHMLSYRVYLHSDEQTLWSMRQKGNILKRGMSPSEASSKIQQEWNDFRIIVLPRKSLANLVIYVSQDHQYSVTSVLSNNASS